MPDFTIKGNPGTVRSKAGEMRSKADVFTQTSDALSAISTGGWSGRAAERFLEKFSTEPDRWRESGNGFRGAASALEVYAEALDAAKTRAADAKGEYARGEQVTSDARNAYDSDVDRAKGEAANAEAAGQTVTLTILPFNDPGAAIRQAALEEYESAKSDLEIAAQIGADGVRRGCVDAPAKRTWYEKVGAAVGGFVLGAGEAIYDLAKLATFLTNPAAWMFNDMMQDASSGMTAEEIAAKNNMRVEDAQGMLQALKDDPMEFGKNIGKAMLDWDTWADDPARAAGHLLPDAIIAALTGGTGTAATRGVKGGVDAIDGLADMANAGNRLDDLGDAGDLGKLDDLGDLGRLDDLGDADGPGGMHEHTSDDFRSLDDQLNDPSYSGANRDIIEPDYDPLGGEPTPEAFKEKYRVETDDPNYPEDWNWPGNRGAVEGSERIVDPDVGPIDRIGSPNGSFFSPENTPFGERSLPPDRLNFNRDTWHIDLENPKITSGEVKLEASDVTPDFGQKGGGTQYRFLDAEGNALTRGQLEELNIISSGAP